MSKVHYIDLPTVTINGSKKPYGAYIYSVSFNLGVDSPSSLEIHLINESGEYATPTISYSQKQTIKIGNFKFVGYLYKYTINKEERQRTLVLNYVDSGIILDKLFIGLHKSHGYNPDAKDIQRYKGKYKFQTHPNLIILGEENSPCDLNADGTINEAEIRINPENFFDPCDPCASSVDRAIKRCREIECSSILPVSYKFEDLIKSIRNKNIKISGTIPNVVDTYRGDISKTGPLRSVLQNWCQDLGFYLYWDFSTESIKFIDIKKKDSQLDKLNISFEHATNYTEEHSLEDTCNVGVVTQMFQDSAVNQYSCEDNQKMSLRPVTTFDFYKEFYDGLDSKTFSLSCACAYYSQLLRDAFLWYGVYNIKTIDRAKDLKIETNSQTSHRTTLEQLNNKTLFRFGNMSILDVWDKNSSQYFNCLTLLSEDELEKVNARITNEDSNEYYFLLVNVNEELLSNKFEEEEQIARELMGRYWMRKFNSRIPLYDNNIDARIITPSNDNARLLRPKSLASDFPLGRFNYIKGSNIDSLIKESINQFAVTEQSLQNLINDRNYFRLKTTQDTLASGLILAEREPKWYPTPEEVNLYAKEFLNYEDYLFKFLNYDGKSSDIINDAYNNLGEHLKKYVKKDSLKILLVSEFKEFTWIANEASHPTDDGRKEPVIIGEHQSSDCYTSKDREIKRVGLGGNGTWHVNINGFNFYPPSFSIIEPTDVNKWQSFNLNNSLQNSSDIEDTSDGLYTIYISQSQVHNVKIPKLQSIQQKIEPKIEAAHFDLIDYNIGHDLYRLFSPNSCTVDLETLQNIHSELAKILGYNSLLPTIKKNFTILGLPPADATLDKGLQELSVDVTEEGVFTSLTFTNRPPYKKNLEYELSKLRSLLSANNKYKYPLAKK